MNSAANFDIWIKIVETRQLADYKNGALMHINGKKIMENAKHGILKSYFSGVNSEILKKLMIDDEDE
jgi:hypothetical protein